MIRLAFLRGSPMKHAVSIGSMWFSLCVCVLWVSGCGGDSAGSDTSADSSDSAPDTGTEADTDTGTDADTGTEMDTDGDTGTSFGGLHFELEARDRDLSVDFSHLDNSLPQPASYEWDFGDGGSAMGETPSVHTYAVDGDYTVTLTVKTEDGDTIAGSRPVAIAQRFPGDYAPDNATTGVPDIVRDRLFVLNLEKADKRNDNTPSVGEETIYITRSGNTCILKQNNVTVYELPAENAYPDGDQFILDRLHIRGYVDVRAENITIRRSIIEGLLLPDSPELPPPAGVDTGRRILRGNNAATVGLRLEDIEIVVPEAIIHGDGVNSAFHHGLGLEASRLTLLRSEVSGTIDGMQIHQGAGNTTDVRIERCWLHDMQFHEIDAERTDGDASHSDAIQVECSMPAQGDLFGVQIVGNTLDVTGNPNLNAAIMITRNACATHGLLVNWNFIDGAVLPVNAGSGTAASHIEFYANHNRFGMNRATGNKPDKTWNTSASAKVMAVKSNTDSSLAYDNYDTSKTQSYVYFSFDPPTVLDGEPVEGEPNLNVMVEHLRGSEEWGTDALGTAGIGLY